MQSKLDMILRNIDVTDTSKTKTNKQTKNWKKVNQQKKQLPKENISGKKVIS